MKAPWSISTQVVMNQLAVKPDVGLSAAEADRRLAELGPNSLVVKKQKNRLNLFLKQLRSPVVYVLVGAAMIAFALNEALDAWSILAIVVLNTLIGFFQESKAEASIEALAAIAGPKAKILRQGMVLNLASEQVCKGDILILEAGDYIPADARVLVARQLAVDESILTGESLPIHKSSEEIPIDTSLAERTNMLFASTAISRGTGKAVVVATAKETEIGKIAEMMQKNESEPTPLQIRLEAVSQRLIWIGIGVIIFIIALGIYQGRTWVDVLMSALSLSIAAIPEGLPTVVTVALVMAIHRMSGKKVLIRKMDSVETLGATDIICTDKTGTLTTGKMQVRDTFTLNTIHSDHLLNAMVICNNASLDQGGNGDTTEIALLEYASKQSVDLQKVKIGKPRIFEWSFDSDRKRMSVAVDDQGQKLIYLKGAPESMLPHCDLSDNDRDRVLAKISEYSHKGMRVLGYAWKVEQSAITENISVEQAESNLIFLGLTAMADPPRPESMEAIKKCQASGIRVIMITGDHPLTAAAIAYELGIVPNPSAPVVTGKELETMSNQELLDTSEKISVYARVSPANKLQLVSALKSQGHIVAMTGDGVNDAPALKAASIGVAMGRGGTEVARQASSMILTNDNFATIVDAVEEGRAVNLNIKRTLQYLLSTNLAELMFIISATCIGWPVPLLPVNLLWLNLVSDGLPSLALAAEKVPPRYLEEGQGPSAKSFFDKAFYQEMIFVGLVITLISLGVYRYGLTNYDLLTARSLAFSCLVYSILFRSFSCRSETKTFFEMKPNIYHLIAVILPIIFQVSMPEFGLMREIFKIKPLSLHDNLIILAVSLIPVSLVEIFKIWRRR